MTDARAKTFYFTFMQKQAFKDHYIEIVAIDSDTARECMVRHFGDKWAFQYDEEKFLPTIEQFNLKRLMKLLVVEYGIRPGDSVGYEMEAT